MGQDSKFFELKGTHYEQGVQQGKLMNNGFDNEFDYIMELQKEKHPILNIIPIKRLTGILGKIGSSRILKSIKEFCPNQYDFIRGLANGMKISENLALAINFGEVLFCHKDFKINNNLRPFSEILLEYGLSGVFPKGCTSIAVSAEKSDTSGLLMSKNLDYHIAYRPFLIERHQIFDNGVEIIGDTGIPLAGVLQGMNNKGLAISMNYGYPLKKISKGIPCSILFQACLEECETVEEVKKFLEARPRSGGAIAIAGDSANNASVIEIGSDKIAYRNLNNANNTNQNNPDFLVATNHYLTKEVLRYQIPINGIYSGRTPELRLGRRIFESSNIRYLTAEKMLQDQLKSGENTKISVETLKSIHSSHGLDGKSPSYNSLCTHDEEGQTIMWAIFDIKNKRMGSAIGRPCETTLKFRSF